MFKENASKRFWFGLESWKLIHHFGQWSLMNWGSLNSDVWRGFVFSLLSVLSFSSLDLCSLRWDVFGSFHRALSIECCSSAIGDDSAMNVLSKVVISIQAGRDFAPVLTISTHWLFSNTHRLCTHSFVLTVLYIHIFYSFSFYISPGRVRLCLCSTGDDLTATIFGTLTCIIFSIFSYTATIFGSTLFRVPWTCFCMLYFSIFF